MKYSGKIANVNHIVVSDPDYGSDVTCRFEKNKINGKNWDVSICINEICEPTEYNFNIEGIEFIIGMNDLKEPIQVHEDGTISYLMGNFVKKYEIGMDTARVYMGVNDKAKKTKADKTDFSLNTLADGYFGKVFEGTRDGKTTFIGITGFLDKDTGYTVEDIVEYFKYQFEIDELELEKDEEEETR